MRKIIFFILIVVNSSVKAQEEKAKTFVVNRQRKNQDDTKQNALQAAIEKVFGNLISKYHFYDSYTNDVKNTDEIINIKKYKVGDKIYNLKFINFSYL